jgi:DNA-binding LacI/PurR family transcriptional regulator
MTEREALRPTLAAVAARAGVSASTASLAFSGTGPVSDATRERVLAAARELGYGGPDPRARSLRRGRSGIVGVVSEERVRDAFHDPIKIAMLDGLSQELGAIDAG